MKSICSIHSLKRQNFLHRRTLRIRRYTQTKDTHNKKESIHPRIEELQQADRNYMMDHPIWSPTEASSIQITHSDPKDFTTRLAYYSVKTIRSLFDYFTGYNHQSMTEKKWLFRIIFLETVAGVPGMMGAMVRHLKSLRSFKRDYGWIHTLLEEAENERMHLLTALTLRQPSFSFRAIVLMAQGIFVNFFFMAYLISPRYCHSFVGYLEEEAVKTYTICLRDIENNVIPWKTKPAPEIAISYWHLAKDATMKDVILAIRADEALHREVNHTFSKLKVHEKNPY